MRIILLDEKLSRGRQIFQLIVENVGVVEWNERWELVDNGRQWRGQLDTVDPDAPTNLVKLRRQATA